MRLRRHILQGGLLCVHPLYAPALPPPPQVILLFYISALPPGNAAHLYIAASLLACSHMHAIYIYYMPPYLIITNWRLPASAGNYEFRSTSPALRAQAVNVSVNFALALTLSTEPTRKKARMHAPQAQAVATVSCKGSPPPSLPFLPLPFLATPHPTSSTASPHPQPTT